MTNWEYYDNLYGNGNIPTEKAPKLFQDNDGMNLCFVCPAKKLCCKSDLLCSQCFEKWATAEVEEKKWTMTRGNLAYLNIGANAENFIMKVMAGLVMYVASLAENLLRVTKLMMTAFVKNVRIKKCAKNNIKTN